MKKTIIPILAGFTLTLILILAGCSKGEDLSLKFKEGDSRSYEVTVDQELTQSAEGQAFTLSQGFKLLYDFNVLSVSEEKAELGFDFAFTDFHVKSNLSDVELPENLPELLNSAFNFEKGSPLMKLTIDKKGRVEKVEGYSDFLAKVMEKAKEEKLSDRVLTLLSALTEEKNITDNFSVLFGYLTDKPIKKAMSWSVKEPFQEGLPLSADSKWKVLDVNEDTIAISKVTSISEDKEAAGKNQSDTGNTTGIESTKYTISRTDGWPREIKSDLSMKSTVVLPAGAQSDSTQGAAGQAVEIAIKNTTSVKRVEK